MLNKAKTLTGYKLVSLDGETGKIKEFYFADGNIRQLWEEFRVGGGYDS
jgi:hypothetical protein